MTKKVEILFPQIPQIFFADSPNSILKICVNLRKKSAKSAGKVSAPFLSCTKMKFKLYDYFRYEITKLTKLQLTTSHNDLKINTIRNPPFRNR
jgi:hypothetical protein